MSPISRWSKPPRPPGPPAAPERLGGVAGQYDYVELTAPAGEWPAGTRGHLIEVYPGGGGLVEVDGAAESESPALDFLPSVDVATLRVLGSPPPRRSSLPVELHHPAHRLKPGVVLGASQRLHHPHQVAR